MADKVFAASKINITKFFQLTKTACDFEVSYKTLQKHDWRQAYGTLLTSIL